MDECTDGRASRQDDRKYLRREFLQVTENVPAVSEAVDETHLMTFEKFRTTNYSSSTFTCKSHTSETTKNTKLGDIFGKKTPKQTKNKN